MEMIVQTPSKTYPVFIGEDALHHLKKHLEVENYTNLLIITDESIEKLHYETLKSYLPESYPHVKITVPTGEEAKQFSVYESCLTYALENGLDRKSCIIAFGGGAVGDLSGFVAATYMRGIPFIQVPTTILAHDSAVGGKTGINHPLGKNLIGSFHQPEAVFYNTSFLQTLPEREIRSGFSEIIKHALISDQNFLSFLMNEITDFSQLNTQKLGTLLKRGIEIKANIVAQDEKETGLRAILNFGHTLGHVIEATSGYGKVTHGEAVMTGMVYALYLSRTCTGLNFDVSAFESWIKQLGYKLEIPDYFNFDHALIGMKRDKKSFASKPRFVLLERIGQPVLREIDDDLLRSTFQTFINTTSLD